MGNRAETKSSKVGFAGKLIIAGRIALGAAAPVAVIGIAEACGDGNDTPSNTGQRTETPGTLPSQTGLTESPTLATTEAPTIVSTIAPTEASTPEPTPKEVKKIFDAEFQFTTYATVQDSVNAIFEKHPEVTSFKDKSGQSTSKEIMLNYMLPACQSGNPEDQGIPSLVVQDRIARCSSMTASFNRAYVETNDDVYLKAAVDTYNYARTELPDHVEDINQLLIGFGVTK